MPELIPLTFQRRLAREIRKFLFSEGPPRPDASPGEAQARAASALPTKPRSRARLK